MINPNTKIKLVGGYTARPQFDQATFPETCYKIAYDLYWLIRDSGTSTESMDLTGAETIQYLKDNDLQTEYAKFNTLREQCASKGLTLVLYGEPRQYETQSSHYPFWAWGLLTMRKSTGQETEGLMVLWDGNLSRHYGIISVPNGFKAAYDE